ncbi:hypothetical protein [Desulfosporosinus orientis]|nr:hypothetical protein [Desulfosporosinus orientis]
MKNQAERRSKKPEWYMQTIRRLNQYPEDKKRLCILTAQLEREQPKLTAGYSLTPGGDKISDQTGGIAAKRWETSQEIKECTLRIEEIDIILAGFEEDEKKLIELRYFSKHNYDWWVAEQVNLSLRTYYRVRDELVAEAAVLLGLYRRDQVRA